ncbi:glycosyltransferase [Pseudomonas aeruginosa]|nr:glycosyltransferase [Pseudomonas aeruginosa]
MATVQKRKNPFSELYLLTYVWRLLWRLRPDVLHLVTIKPVIYGGIAARLAPVKGVVAAVSGLGFRFHGQGSEGLRVSCLCRLALSAGFGQKKLRVIFQNPDDRDALIGLGAITFEKSVLIRGSGVDLTQYQPAPESPENAGGHIGGSVAQGQGCAGIRRSGKYP